MPPSPAGRGDLQDRARHSDRRGKGDAGAPVPCRVAKGQVGCPVDGGKKTGQTVVFLSGDFGGGLWLGDLGEFTYQIFLMYNHINES